MVDSDDELRLAVSDGTERFLHPGSATRFAVSISQTPALVGRLPHATVSVRSDNVSRQHAQIEHGEEGWRIRDIGSKAGTRVNQVVLRRDEWHALNPGDAIQLGPIHLAVEQADSLRGDSRRLLTWESSDDRSSIIAKEPSGHVSAIPEQDLSGLAQQRLNVLLQSAGRLNDVAEVATLFRAIAESATAGTGSPRAIVIGVGGADDWRILGCSPPQINRAPEIEISRSLVNLARRGQVAQLRADESQSKSMTQSIVSLDIHSALCVPIRDQQRVAAVLYLDTRGSERPIERDAAAFCAGLAQLAELALSNLQRAELAKREKMLREELAAARAAQQLMLPPPRGSHGPIHYALETTPGTIVAGDLFDVLPIDGDTAIVLLGDVMGKGAAAGLMMAAVQTYFRAVDHSRLDLASWVDSANRYFCRRFAGTGFVTLWLGLFRRDRQVVYVDAGHGHWCLAGSAGGVRTVESAGGPPLGLLAEAEYAAGDLRLSPAERVVLYSDGLIEQPDVEQELFGESRAREALDNSRSPEEDVECLSQAHAAFRGAVELSDDLTLASIGFLP